MSGVALKFTGGTEGDPHVTVLDGGCCMMNEPSMLPVKRENNEGNATLTIRPEDQEKMRIPQPPKDPPTPRTMSRSMVIRKTRLPDEVNTGLKATMVKLLPNDAVEQPLVYTGPKGLRFDAQGMVLPHSILGSLEDFRKELEARGEVELVKRISDVKKQQIYDAREQKLEIRPKSRLQYEPDQEGHALEHWRYHMAERRKQQNFISKLLQKPVEDLLMNQSNSFRETQEERERISRALPALYLGQSACMGSEFWNIPQRFGDELSEILITLTQKERGNIKPITHIKQPHSIRLETGNVLAERSGSRAWSHSQYLKHRQNELRNVLNDPDFIQLDLDGLEIVGSSLPFSAESVDSCRKKDGNEGEREEIEDPPVVFDDVVLDVKLLPALRIGGELARWDGRTSTHQGEIGVSVCLTFEAMVGENTCSQLELKNEGSTVIYYSWQKLERPHSFPEATKHRQKQQFYFNTSSAAILPGDTEQILITFKNTDPGITTEQWILHTHPSLMGGAILQVTLKSVALSEDKTTQQRAALELELEHRVAKSVCRSVVFELVNGIHTPVRPRSPAELFITDEEQFNTQNPNLHYHHGAVEALKSLWEQAKCSKVTKPEDRESEPATGSVWDLSITSLHQVVLSLPPGDTGTTEESARLCGKEALSQFNMFLLQLYQSKPTSAPLTRHTIGLQLFRDLADRLASEAQRLRHVLGLPENRNWAEDIRDELKEEEMMESKAAALSKKEEEPEKKAASGSKKKEEKKKSSAKSSAKDKAAEGRSRSKKSKEPEKAMDVEQEVNIQPLPTPVITTAETIEPQIDIDPELLQKYRHTLRQQVYVLMEEMIDSFWDIFEEVQGIQENLQNDI